MKNGKEQTDIEMQRITCYISSLFLFFSTRLDQQPVQGDKARFVQV